MGQSPVAIDTRVVANLLVLGIVSKSALDSGGYVHGIVPTALVERASQNGSEASASKTSGPVPGDTLKSGEGSGTDLLEDDVDGRLTVEVVGTMHEVCRSSQRVYELIRVCLMGPIEETQDG
jgi:hypothetical protein